MRESVLFVLLMLVYVDAAAVPSWKRAEEVMTSCYGGWDVTITLDAGVKGEYKRAIFDSEEESRQDGEGRFSSYDNQNSSSSTEESITTSSKRAEEELYDSYESSSSDGFDNSFGSSAFVGVKMTVPLYDRVTRLSRKEKTNSQVGKLADLYAKFEGHRATLMALEMETKVSKRVMMDGGQSAISAYFSLLTQKEKSRALAKSAERQIMMILRNCGYERGKK